MIMENTRECKQKEVGQSSSRSGRRGELPAAGGNRSLTEEVKLAAVAISLNVRLRSADMPTDMQELAIRYTRSLLQHSSSSPKSGNNVRRPNPTLLARALKQEFDERYGPAWHCVVGKSFGSFVTHSPGGFVYFSLDSLSVLLFKTQLRLVPQSAPNPSS